MSVGKCRTYDATWIANAKMWYLYILCLVAHLRVLLFIFYIVVTFLYMPFVPVYKGFIWIIQFYRSVSPSDFLQSLDESVTQWLRAFGNSCIYFLYLMEYFDRICHIMYNRKDKQLFNISFKARWDSKRRFRVVPK